MESDELLFIVSTPSPTRHVPIVNATAILTRQVTLTTLLPPRKTFIRMTSEHDLYNAILDYVAEKGLGWAMEHLSSTSEFFKYITSAFWALDEKVFMISVLYGMWIYFWIIIMVFDFNFLQVWDTIPDKTNECC